MNDRWFRSGPGASTGFLHSTQLALLDFFAALRPRSARTARAAPYPTRAANSPATWSTRANPP